VPDDATHVEEEIVEDGQNPGGDVDDGQHEKGSNDPRFVRGQVGGQDRVPCHFSPDDGRAGTIFNTSFSPLCFISKMLARFLESAAREGQSGWSGLDDGGV